ncbi:MAG: GGDEF domain-containing protein, partial [Burkholderiales bacterium]|nr:GGDEF domain-containing protein [Burkholderiales bacterium]
MTELPNIARLFLALFLLSIWLTRRPNRTPLCWAFAYFALAAASISFRFGTASGNTFLVYLASVFPGIYVGMFWAGTQYFREQAVRWQTLTLLICGTSSIILLVMSISMPDSGPVVGVAVGLINSWAAWVIWKRNPKYRIVAGIVLVQAMMLALSYWRIWQGPSVGFGMAAGYGILVIGLVYVILRESNESISRQATTDELTSLPNRHLLLDRLDSAIRRSTSVATLTSAVLVIDIDNLRRFNEAFGHAAGDQLLIEIASRLQLVAGSQHTLARYGGDEFAFLVTETTPEDAIRRAEEIASRTVEAMRLPFPVAGTTTALTVSIGIAISGDDGHYADLLVQRAKLATSQTSTTDGYSWR